MKRRLSSALLILALLAPGLEADTVVLKTGERLEGEILSETADSLFIRVQGRENRSRRRLERIGISRRSIASIRYLDLDHAEEDRTLPRDPDFNSLMFCPTPATVPKGDFYFRDFELYILNFGWGLRETTSLSFMTHFPIVSVLDFGSVGFKQRLLDRRKRKVGLALAGSLTFGTWDIENDSFWTGSLILGMGNRERSLNLALNQSYRRGGSPFTFLVLGGDRRMSRRSKLMFEIIDGADLLDDLGSGFVNLGLRFFGRDWSFTLSGLRPLEETGRLLFIPMIQFSYHAE